MFRGLGFRGFGVLGVLGFWGSGLRFSQSCCILPQGCFCRISRGFDCSALRFQGFRCLGSCAYRIRSIRGLNSHVRRSQARL